MYQEVYDKIQMLYKPTEHYHPLKDRYMKFLWRLSPFLEEARIRMHSRPKHRTFHILKYALQSLSLTFIGMLLMRTKTTTKEVEWGNYRSDVVRNSDYQKFECGIKMILDSSHEQTQALTTYLDQMQKKHRLVFGYYLCSHAMVTCYIQSYNKNHIHFIDGSDGGYAMASKMLKENLNKQSYS